jgi:hypothetical protein
MDSHRRHVLHSSMRMQQRLRRQWWGVETRGGAATARRSCQSARGLTLTFHHRSALAGSRSTHRCVRGTTQQRLLQQDEEEKEEEAAAAAAAAAQQQQQQQEEGVQGRQLSGWWIQGAFRCKSTVLCR